MTPETKRTIFRYALPIDLVIVTTGLALLFPSGPLFLTIAFLTAVAVSSWKGGPGAGIAATAGAVLAILAAFSGVMTLTQLTAFAVAGSVLTLALHSMARLQVARATPEGFAFDAIPEAEPEPDAEPEPEPVVAARVALEPAERPVTLPPVVEAAPPVPDETLARADEMLRERIEEERVALQKALDEQREAGEETLRRRIEEERAVLQKAVEQQLAEARAEMERLAQERIAEAQREAEQRVIGEETLRRRLDEEREALQKRVQEELAAARAQLEQEAQQRIAEAERRAAQAMPGAQQRSLFGTISDWLRAPRRTAPKRIVGVAVSRPPSISAKTVSAPQKPAPGVATKPRLLLLERRRGTADVAVPRLRQRGIEVAVVERWIDAVDEIFRFKPDALLIDSELPDFTKVCRTILDQRASLPLYVTVRSSSFTPSSEMRCAGFIARPYDVDELVTVAREAHSSPQQVLSRQAAPRVAAAAPAAPPSVPQAAPPAPLPAVPPSAAVRSDGAYEVACFHCRSAYDATSADWCSCLTKERTLLCANCLTCFCKAPPSYKEKFWLEAPPRLFEKKMAEARVHQTPLSSNPSAAEARRPLVLAVDDDEDIRLIVQRVCSNLNYGFVHAADGQEGLAAAREYRPNLILSDAFMPKLDGREMCRQLRDEGFGRDCRMVVMTGLYTDTKYRSEALRRFMVDDYLAKPVSVAELVALLQRNLEGSSSLPSREPIEEDVPLPELLEAQEESAPVPVVEPGPAVEDAAPAAAPNAGGYEVSCHACSAAFDALTAEWCTCLGRDQTLVCGACGICFCKAPATYKERFWMDAPSSLFERKMIGSKRNITLRTNPAASHVRRPLILLVEDDENIQLIVRTVVTSMGFGFVVGANGQEGLALAREYNPDLILSDAFMPKLDGREMCRLLKEDPATARIRAIIMTGLYTDRKYRNEALDYFKVDDYVAKPLAVEDLIKLFKKHLPHEAHQTM